MFSYFLKMFKEEPKKIVSLSVVLPNNPNYDVFHDVTVSILDGGILYVLGKRFESEEETENFYAPGSWIKTFTWYKD